MRVLLWEERRGVYVRFHFDSWTKQLAGKQPEWSQRWVQGSPPGGSPPSRLPVAADGGSVPGTRAAPRLGGRVKPPCCCCCGPTGGCSGCSSAVSAGGAASSPPSSAAPASLGSPRSAHRSRRATSPGCCFPRFRCSPHRREPDFRPTCPWGGDNIKQAKVLLLRLANTS